jgi:hypothetical protein
MKTLISLGDTCHPANMIRKYSENNLSFPFDWGYITDNGLCKILNDGPKCIDTINTNIRQIHEKEFKIDCYEYQISHISNNPEEVKKIIERRMLRFYNFIEKEDTVCIRYCQKHEYTDFSLPLICKYEIVCAFSNGDIIKSKYDINDTWEKFIKRLMV